MVKISFLTDKFIIFSNVKVFKMPFLSHKILNFKTKNKSIRLCGGDFVIVSKIYNIVIFDSIVNFF